jgi:hypothetical protein
MQRGSLVKAEQKNGPDVWQFRWSEKGGDGRRVYRKRVIGTIGRLWIFSGTLRPRQLPKLWKTPCQSTFGSHFMITLCNSSMS